MKRKLGAVLFVIYSMIAILVTVLLLSFNEYNCSEIGGYTVYIVNDDALEPEYEENSILLVKETSDKHVKVGDEIFLYKVIDSQNFEFVSRTLENKTQQGRHIIYEVEGEEYYDSTYFVGKTEDTIVIKGWGWLLTLLESKWGYLFCIVIVSLLLFLQEVFDLAIELKYGSGKSSKTTKTSKATKTTKTASTSTKTTATTATKAASAAKTAAKAAATVTKVNDTQTTEE